MLKKRLIKKDFYFNLKKNKSICIAQILILLIAIFSFAYLVGITSKEIKFVSAQATADETLTEPTLPISTETQEPPSRATMTEEGVTYTYNKEFYVQRGEEKYQVPDKADKNGDGKIDDKEGESWIKTGLNGIASVGGTITASDTALKALGKEKGLSTIFGKGGKPTAEISKDVTNKAVKAGGKSIWKNAEGGISHFGRFAASAAGAAVGSFINWAIFKWAVGADVRNMRDVTAASGIGFAAGTIGGTIIGSLAAGSTAAATAGTFAAFAASTGGAIVIALVIALVISGIISLFLFRNYSQETFNYIVTAWKAPPGGNFCDKCNDLEFGCSEYQCRSFGKACEIKNSGTTAEACVWIDPNDIFPPVISALKKVLLSEDYEYKPLPEEEITGVKIFYKKDSSGKGCVPPYTSLKLGIETDKYADCKIDSERKSSYAEMTAPMTRSEEFIKEFILELPHVATPSVESQQNATIPDYLITNGQAQEFFIRCESVNGYSNPDEYIMEFCVQDGPDVFPPIILGTNFLQNSFLQYNQSEAHLEIYTNEPAECKWSFEDLDYGAMQFELNSCSQSEGDYMFSQFKYGCTGQLTGMKDRVKNTAYIKCKDKPWWTEADKGSRYANEQPYVLTLKGTEPLVLDKISVNEKSSGAIIKDSVPTTNIELKAETKFGAENGKSRCQYEFGGNWINFYNEGSSDFLNLNTQRIPLGEGFYNYSIRCFDAGGNSDKGNIEFTIELDNLAPVVARAYYDVNNLKIISNEPAECVYTTQQNIACAYEFKDGTAMNEIGESTHYTSWQANKKYLIKCKDAFGNQPLPGECSIIVKAFESFK